MEYVSFEDAKKIAYGMSKKVPRGIMVGDSQVGHITWQMTLLKDYLKLDGTALGSASTDYAELLEFAQKNNLITTEDDNSLFSYDSELDILVLPNFMDKSLWSGEKVEEKEAGLPNITGRITANSVYVVSTGTEAGSGAFRNRGGATDSTINIQNASGFTMSSGFTFDASNSNSIYSDDVTTVQPPAIQLIPQIKYKKSSTLWERVEIGRFVSTAPSYYKREGLFDTEQTIMTLKPTWVNIDGSGYVLQENKEINVEDSDNWDDASYAIAANRAGKDFYIYACKSVSDDAPNFILSANSTVPIGYAANDSRKIGGFHCLCLSVGTISGHTLSDYITGDILPASPWDLSHRAESENEGMVFIKPLGLWGDIYLGSWNGSNLASEFNQVCVTGESAKKMHGIMMAEEYGLVSKFLPSYDEFIVCAKGTPEGDHISTGAVPTGAGGHVGTNGKRIISNYGLEDCVGVLWQWSRDCPEDYHQVYNSGTAYRGSYMATANDYWLSGYAWIDNPVYNSNVDTVKRGSSGGLLRRLLLGGYSSNAVTNCGSRTVTAHDFGSPLTPDLGGRGFSRKR